ncbi:MAG TPA: xanthine dehydrogenase family protein subunit M, partial [Nonomuraea sp.]|nr:xanthine dehydrogenase family protein subunit M [Nonomuraea sp.]
GVAAKPWRARAAERALLGGPATEEAFARAADAELAPAITRPGNAFKARLARATITATLRDLSREAA